MPRFPAILPLVLLAVLSLKAQSPAVEPVLQAELAFARLAAQKGIRTAFLTWLVSDAKVFSPRLISAKEQYGPEPGDPGHLEWYPEAMGICASGDLAWSLGPWTYAPKKGEAVLVHGHFLSVWRKQPDGRWKVVADIGVPHGAPERPIEPFAVWDAAPRARKALPKMPDATPALLEKEAQLAAAWAEKGGLVLLTEIAKEGRVLRRGRPPVQNAADLQAALAADPPGPKWEPALVQVASSGDLGWTCGETGPDVEGVSASFLRIWTHEAGGWKVLFDVRLPHPTTTR
jgi:ketosteroid isomerase-like protein